MTRPAFIIPVHNRRETTRACLRALQADDVFNWADIVVVDDGSTDGTAKMIAEEFPAARVVTGDGNLWWTGAIARGMAAAGDAECFVWLNDDALPQPGACHQLVHSARESGGVVTAQCRTKTGGLLTYGGLVRRGISLRLFEVGAGSLREVDAACGNFVVIPRAVVAAIGLPDARCFPHAHGDTDFTLRAKRAGFAICVDPAAVATARPNALANYTSWLLSDIRIADIWRPLADRRSYAYAPAHARFLARHFGGRGAAYWIWTVVKRVPITLLRLTTPLAWRRQVWGRRSRVWQEERALHRALNENTSSHPAATPPTER